jgi:hypothetical protein
MFDALGNAFISTTLGVGQPHPPHYLSNTSTLNNTGTPFSLIPVLGQGNTYLYGFAWFQEDNGHSGKDFIQHCSKLESQLASIL